MKSQSKRSRSAKNKSEGMPSFDDVVRRMLSTPPSKKKKAKKKQKPA